MTANRQISWAGPYRTARPATVASHRIASHPKHCAAESSKWKRFRWAMGHETGQCSATRRLSIASLSRTGTCGKAPRSSRRIPPHTLTPASILYWQGLIHSGLDLLGERDVPASFRQGSRNKPAGPSIWMVFLPSNRTPPPGNASCSVLLLVRARVYAMVGCPKGAGHATLALLRYCFIAATGGSLSIQWGRNSL